jgi:hypothetical protein
MEEVYQGIWPILRSVSSGYPESDWYLKLCFRFLDGGVVDAGYDCPVVIGALYGILRCGAMFRCRTSNSRMSKCQHKNVLKTPNLPKHPKGLDATHRG